ncbi:hypothetical protein [Blastococcus capsensis]|uniref:hypothetical protein n=1 Tax=Blastococcus capsensis TaxID=1564163 RepID=UPI0025424238|nr:hypothetical protein [Blastococcus capsensis]MDK3255301.1 hypothetical protein [Blastococcus capsensis]
MKSATISMYQSGPAGWAAAERVAGEQLPGRPVGPVQTVASTPEEPRSLGTVRAGCTGELPECGWFAGDVGSAQPTYGSEVVVADIATAAAASDARWRDHVGAALRAGRAVVFGSGAVDDAGQVTLAGSTWNGTREVELGRVALPATEIDVSATELLRVPALPRPARAGRRPARPGDARRDRGGAARPTVHRPWGRPR